MKLKHEDRLSLIRHAFLGSPDQWPRSGVEAAFQSSGDLNDVPHVSCPARRLN